MQKTEDRWAFQDDLVEESIEILQKKKRLALLLSPGTGKTVTALKIARKFIDAGKRVGVSTFSRNEIKTHWIQEIIEHGFFDAKEVQIIASCKDMKSYQGLPRDIATNLIDDVDTKRPLTLFIPQTINGKKVGKFDLIIVDEAHQFLEVEGGILQALITKSSKKDTKLIALTGTGHDLISSGTFDRKDPDVGVIIRDVPFAIKGKRILPVDIDICYFDFALNKKCYTRQGDLNGVGKSVLKSDFATSMKINTILNHIKNKKKTLIICSPGTDTNVFIHDLLNDREKGSCVIKSSYLSRDHNDVSEHLFRTDPKVKYMAVVAMAGIGWNFAKLDCVLDLSFSRNVKLMIQRMGRSCRYYAGKKPSYVYCSDNSRPAYDAHLLIGEALALMREDGILNYEMLKIAYDEEKVKSSRNSYQRNEIISLGSIARFFKGAEPNVKMHHLNTLSIITLDHLRRNKGRKPAYHDYLHRFWRKMVNKRLLADYNKNDKLKNYIKELKKTVPEYSDLFQIRIEKFIENTYKEEFRAIENG